MRCQLHRAGIWVVASQILKWLLILSARPFQKQSSTKNKQRTSIQYLATLSLVVSNADRLRVARTFLPTAERSRSGPQCLVRFLALRRLEVMIRAAFFFHGWDYLGGCAFGRNREGESAREPTGMGRVKPVLLVPLIVSIAMLALSCWLSLENSPS